jgi:hypothetical protein
LAELEAALAAFMTGDKTRQLAVRVMDRLIARCNANARMPVSH